MIKKKHILDWLNKSAEVLEEKKSYLTKLDTAIGDADHGNNMNRGFKKVLEQLPTNEKKDIGAILKGVAMSLISTVGGASGPLYGTMFLQAGNSVSGKEELTAEDLKKMLQAGVDGIVMRGKAKIGDKTMIDALEPAVKAYSSAVSAGDELTTALQKAVDAAEKGVEDTIPLIARKGRASYLGERSKGHQDPGATSSYYLLKALRDSVQ